MKSYMVQLIHFFIRTIL